MRRPRIFTVEDPIFKTEPLFVLGCDADHLRAYLRRRGWRVHVSPEASVAGQLYTFDRMPWRLVWTCELDPALILHEVFHLVTRICADKGITIRAHNEQGQCDDETAAYLFEFFARRVLRRLR